MSEKVHTRPTAAASRRTKVGRKSGTHKPRGSFSKKQAYPPTRVLYVRGFPAIASDADILAVFKNLAATSEIFVLPNSNEAFVQVETTDRAIECVKYFQKSPATIRGHEIQVSFSGRDEITTSRVNKDQPSSVLLVTMCNVKVLFSPDQMREVFEEYGQVLKIINFIKEKYGLQSLVEMESSEAAMLAKEKVDGKSFYGSFNIIKVQHSDLQTLDIEKTSYNCRDFTLIDDPYNQASQNRSPQMSSFASHSMPGFGSAKMMMTSNPYSMYGSMENVDQMQQNYGYSTDMMMNSGAVNPNVMSPIARMATQLEIYNAMMINSMQNTNNGSFETSPRRNSNGGGPNWRKRKGVGITSVLNLTGIPQGYTHDMLFNLLGLYGRVVRVRCQPEIGTEASIEFFDPEEASAARQQLNFLNLQGNTLQVYFSKSERTIEDYMTYNGQEGFITKEYFEGDQQRCTGRKSRDSDAAREGPSSVILIRNITPDIQDYLLHDMSSSALVKNHESGPGHDSLLVSMETAGDAALAISKFHGTVYGNRALDLSFWNF
mmetsp:Transcript_14576/g.16103  ORF Transcript_14576/g.16103 Transcript_14576/m.16103 type:complete len:545 (+) Transcript_14576:223-1857(+)